MFRISTGKMYEEFILSWLSSQDLASLPCTPAESGQPSLEIPACGDQTIFSSATALKTTNVHKLPFCFLPASQTLPAIDAVVFTDRFIITIQVTISHRHTAKESGFTTIKQGLPTITAAARRTNKGGKKEKGPQWCHVFITDHEEKARSLRGQTLSELPRGIFVYSAVFNVGQFNVTSKRMRRLEEDRVSESWLCANRYLLGE
jgi:hypothetical protein